VERNEEHWNGDHCVDAKLVPGVVFANEKIGVDDPGLADFAPTILNHFDLEPSDIMEGRDLFSAKE
jgi:predicted AlkP superfamily phosphohydrolase/phosphomutase